MKPLSLTAYSIKPDITSLSNTTNLFMFLRHPD